MDQHENQGGEENEEKKKRKSHQRQTRSLLAIHAAYKWKGR